MFEEVNDSEQARNEALDRITVMICQETTTYVPVDYIAMQHTNSGSFQKLSSTMDGAGINNSENESNDGGCGPDSENLIVSPEWRQQIADWYLLLAKTFKLKREVVSFAMNYLDRVLSKYSCDRVMLELVASTSIHLAVKVHDSGREDQLKVLPSLSQTGITGEHIAQMEVFMLRSLNWLICPPVVESYLSAMCSVLYHNFRMTLEEMQQIETFAVICCDLAFGDYFFAVKKPSIVAAASVFNALQYVYPPQEGDTISAACQFSEILHEELPSLNLFTGDTAECCGQMCELLKTKGDALGITVTDHSAASCEEAEEPTIALICSPVCVAGIERRM
jgi:hypothetical protein